MYLYSPIQFDTAAALRACNDFVLPNVLQLNALVNSDGFSLVRLGSDNQDFWDNWVIFGPNGQYLGSAFPKRGKVLTCGFDQDLRLVNKDDPCAFFIPYGVQLNVGGRNMVFAGGFPPSDGVEKASARNGLPSIDMPVLSTNEKGVLTGFKRDHDRAGPFLVQDGEIRDLDMTGAPSGVPYHINRHGVAVGFLVRDLKNSASRAALWSSVENHVAPVELWTLIQSEFNYETLGKAFAISSSGWIIASDEHYRDGVYDLVLLKPLKR